MNKLRIGFVPLHRKGFDEKWAVEIKNKVVKASAKLEMVELVYPDD
jgi:hypothetical protein